MVIHDTGIYQATFHSTVSVSAGTTIPSSITARLYLNGAPVTGAVASHTFTSSTEESSLTFSAAFQVTTVPSTVEVQVSDAGFTFNELALTVIRLGDL